MMALHNLFDGLMQITPLLVLLLRTGLLANAIFTTFRKRAAALSPKSKGHFNWKTCPFLYVAWQFSPAALPY